MNGFGFLICLIGQIHVGLEEFSGIPSSIGGLFINLHYFEFLISMFVLRATVYDIKNAEMKTVDENGFSLVMTIQL